MKRFMHTAAVFAALALAAPAHALELEASAGLGYDSNAYRTPDQNYTDYSDTTLCVPPSPLPSCNPITPNVQSGLFVPVELTVGNGAKTGLSLEYKFDGDLYLDSALSNANNQTHDFTLGDTQIVENGDRRTKRVLEFGVRRKTKVYYDRDTGDNKVTSGGSDVSDRFSYLAIGVNGDYQVRHGGSRYGVNGKAETRNYDAVTGAPDYDHNIFNVGALYSFEPADPTDLIFELDYTLLDYTKRHARNLDATFSSTLRQYTDIALKTTLRQQLTANTVARLSYELKNRADNHVGYHDYTGHDFKLRVIQRLEVYKLQWIAGYETRSYDNALAFDADGQPALDYSVSDLGAKMERPFGEDRTLWAELDYHNIDTNDTRYAYARTQVTAGMTWQF